MWYCGHCGQGNDDAFVYCSACGEMRQMSGYKAGNKKKKSRLPLILGAVAVLAAAAVLVFVFALGKGGDSAPAVVPAAESGGFEGALDAIHTQQDIQQEETLPAPEQPAAAAFAPSAPEEWTNVKAILVPEDGDCTIGIKHDGTVLYAGEEDDYTKAHTLMEWTDIDRIEIHEGYFVGYRFDGSVVTTADYDVEQWGNIRKLVISYNDFCAGLTYDGRVLITFGKDFEGDSLAFDTQSWYDIIDIACAGEDLVGLKSDGFIIASGYDWATWNQYGGSWYDTAEEAPGTCGILELVPCMYNVLGIKGTGYVMGAPNDQFYDPVSWCFGTDSAFALRSDGRVATFNFYENGDSRLEQVAAWRDIIQIDMDGFGRYLPVGLCADGTVKAVTKDVYDGKEFDYGCWDVEGWTGVVKIFSGMYYTVGVRADGSVLVTGGEYEGMEGLNEMAAWTDIIDVQGGYEHVVGLRSDGTVVAVGNNYAGQCNVSAG